MIGMHKICVALNKEKDTTSFSSQVPIRTMNTTAGFLLIGMLKIYVALNKEKGSASFRHPVTIRTIRTMVGLPPIPFKISVRKCNYHSRTPPVEACVPICAILSKKSEKYPHQGIWGLNRRFQRKCFSNRDIPPPCTKFALH